MFLLLLLLTPCFLSQTIHAASEWQTIFNPAPAEPETTALSHAKHKFAKTMSLVIEKTPHIGYSFGDNATQARLLFEELFDEGNQTTQTHLAALAHGTHKILGKTYWSAEKKDTEMSHFLAELFAELKKSVPTEQRKQVQELHRYLQLAVTPVISGIKKRLRALPWGKILLGAGIVGAGTMAPAAVKRAHQAIKNSFELLDHINYSLAEAKRETQAFYETLETDTNSHPIRSFDHEAGVTVYLKKGGKLDAARNNRDHWVVAPQGMMDRLLKILETARPMLTALGANMQESASIQAQWYNEFQILQEKGRWRMVSAPAYNHHGEEIQEMRYLSKKTYVNGAPDEDTIRRLSLYKKDSTWFYTYLPERNILERLCNTLEHKTLLKFIEAITLQITQGRDDFIAWLTENGIIAKYETNPSRLADEWHMNADDKGVYYQKENEKLYVPVGVLDKLTSAITTLLKPDSAGHKLIDAIATSMKNGQEIYRQQLRQDGILDTSGKLEEGVQRKIDDTGRAYFEKNGTKIKAEHTATEKLFESIYQFAHGANPQDPTELSKFIVALTPLLSGNAQVKLSKTSLMQLLPDTITVTSIS